jgi:hypothetical protein
MVAFAVFSPVLYVRYVLRAFELLTVVRVAYV